MEIKKIFEDGTVSKYLVKGTTPAFMNTLRRTIMNNTPCLAVDTIKIYENDSVIVDEMLANRLGLRPLKTDSKTYKKGNTVKLVLEATGPKTVTSKDIKSSDPKIEI
ncbi:MAG: DNA-directed RNA polymerase subunit D, partial [archaeon]